MDTLQCNVFICKIYFTLTGIIDNAEDSLFTYAPGESWASFYTPQFMPTFTTTFSDPQLQARANEICGDDQFCLYDIAATRRTEIGLSTLIGNQEFEEIVRISAPSMHILWYHINTNRQYVRIPLI